MSSYTESTLRTLPSTDPLCSAKDDLLLVCASFEERSASVSGHLPNGYRASRAIVYANQEFLCGPAGQATRANIYRMVEAAARHSDTVEVVEGSWLHPQVQWESLRKALHGSIPEGASDPSVTIDITTFNRESLLVATLLLRTRFPSARLRLMYASPKSHGEWLSRGYRTIRNVIGFSGTQYPSRPALLIVLSGFEPERTIKLIEEHEPTLVLLGIGDPPTKEEFLRRNEDDQSLVLARQGVRRFTFSTSDPEACRSTLAGLISQYVLSHNIIIAPMSTKISTLGALAAVEAYPQVQITYCLPGEYNICDYSRGVREIYLTWMPPPPNPSHDSP